MNRPLWAYFLTLDLTSRRGAKRAGLAGALMGLRAVVLAHEGCTHTEDRTYPTALRRKPSMFTTADSSPKPL